jgi:hypothetical protein
MTEQAKKQPKKRTTDWAAVERDYRTGKYTNRELGTKYGVSHQAVAKRAKSGNWQKDLGDAIKSATSARLVEELVKQEVAKSGQEVVNTVLVAAEANAQILLKQQKRAAELQDALEVAKFKVLELAGKVADIREVTSLTQALNNLANATKTLNEQERKAHGMDSEELKKEASYEEMLLAAKNMGLDDEE